MADNVTVDNGDLTDYLVSADEVVGTGEQVQRMKLTYSADGSATHVPADADGLLVNLGANNDVAVTGTVDLGATDNAVLDDIASKLGTIDSDTGDMAVSLQLIDNASVAHDGLATGAGVNMAGHFALSADMTAVGAGDATRAIATLLGKQVVYPYALPGATWQYAGPTGGIVDTADDVLQAAGGTGVRHYLTSLTVINAHATVSTEVVIKDGTTVVHRGYAAAEGGGYTITFPTPLRGTGNTALNVACVTTGSAVHVSASGFTAAE